MVSELVLGCGFVCFKFVGIYRFSLGIYIYIDNTGMQNAPASNLKSFQLCFGWIFRIFGVCFDTGVYGIKLRSQSRFFTFEGVSSAGAISVVALLFILNLSAQDMILGTTSAI